MLSHGTLLCRIEKSEPDAVISREARHAIRPRHNEVLVGYTRTNDNKVTVVIHRNAGDETRRGYRNVCLALVFRPCSSMDTSGQQGRPVWQLDTEIFLPTPGVFTSRRFVQGA